MSQIHSYIPAFKKIIRASELPGEWAVGFTNPDQLVVVTINSSKTADPKPTSIAMPPQIDKRDYVAINLAAPQKADRQALRAMPLSEQKRIYEKAILSAANQPGRKLLKQDIQSAVIKSQLNV